MKVHIPIKKYILIIFIIVCDISATIEHLNPPIIDETTIIKASCDRPRRSLGIITNVEVKNNKTILNCYGHGGSGYVTSFGSVQDTINKFLATSPDINSHIRIIGSGLIGLLMAIELHSLGFKNIRISTKELYDIPSWRAGGVFDPGTGNEKTEQGINFLRLSLDTYHVFKTIEEGKHSYLKNVIYQMPIYCHQDVEGGFEVLAKFKYMPPAEKVTLNFGNGITHENFIKHYTYFIDVSSIMHQLWAEINKRNIPVVIEEIKDFCQIDEPIICNCAGFASGALNNDTNVFLSRGYFFMFNPNAGDKHLNYMIFTYVMQNDKKECIYLFPKNKFVTAQNPEGIESRGVIGGTFITNIKSLNKEEQAALDKLEFDKLFERTKKFFYGNTPPTA